MRRYAEFISMIAICNKKTHVTLNIKIWVSHSRGVSGSNSQQALKLALKFKRRYIFFLDVFKEFMLSEKKQHARIIYKKKQGTEKRRRFGVLNRLYHCPGSLGSSSRSAAQRMALRFCGLLGRIFTAIFILPFTYLYSYDRRVSILTQRSARYIRRNVSFGCTRVHVIFSLYMCDTENFWELSATLPLFPPSIYFVNSFSNTPCQYMMTHE